MHIRWWYGIAVASLSWALYLFLGRSSDLESLLSTPTVGTGLRLFLFAAWFSLPILIALDWRRIQDDVPWELSIGPWLLVSAIWIANVGVGTTYCLRRESALRGDVPSGRWKYGVVAGVVLWSVVVVVDLVGRAVATGVVGAVVSGPLVLLVLVGYPMALYLDLAHIRGYTDWEPSVRFWIVGAIIPVINVLVGLVYIVYRRVEYRQASNPSTVELPGLRTAPTPPVDSPWFRRIALVELSYFLTFVVLGGTPGLVAVDLQVLAGLLWIPFGLTVTPMIYFDTNALTAAGHEWGWTRYFYLSAVAVPPVAFLYLLRRSTAARTLLGRREDELAVEEAAADPDDSPESAV